jgi:hypothetical protein
MIRVQSLDGQTTFEFPDELSAEQRNQEITALRESVMDAVYVWGDSG